MHACARRRPEEGAGSHETGAMDDCEPPDVGPGPELEFSTVSLTPVLFLTEAGATALAKLASQQAFGFCLSLFPRPRLQLCAATSGFYAAASYLDSRCFTHRAISQSLHPSFHPRQVAYSSSRAVSSGSLLQLSPSVAGIPLHTGPC